MPAPRLDVDAPELRLVAQLAGVAPARVVAAYNDPDTFLFHLTAEEVQRLGAAMDCLTGLLRHMAATAAIVSARLDALIPEGAQ